MQKTALFLQNRTHIIHIQKLTKSKSGLLKTLGETGERVLASDIFPNEQFKTIIPL